MGSSHNVFLTGPQVLARYSITEMTLWRWLKDQRVGFPQPMVVNRRRFFCLDDLIAWEKAHMRQQKE